MKVKTPLILVNFKTYDTAMDHNAVKLAKICEQVAKQTKTNIAIAVNALDLKEVCNAVKIPVFAQHVDNIGYGSHTGWIVPQDVKKIGAAGTLLNHAEHKLKKDEIFATRKLCEKLGLITCICASTPEKVKELAKCKPEFLAYEPPALIGGDISVSTAKPDVVKKVVQSVRSRQVLCGAGVKNAQDVEIALQLGTKGVLLASGITKAKNPKKALLDLVSGL